MLLFVGFSVPYHGFTVILFRIMCLQENRAQQPRVGHFISLGFDFSFFLPFQPKFLQHPLPPHTYTEGVPTITNLPVLSDINFMCIFLQTGAHAPCQGWAPVFLPVLQSWSEAQFSGHP